MEPFIGTSEGRRLGALFIDNFIGAISAVVVGYFGSHVSGELGLGAAVLSYLGYFSISEALWFRTLGKKMLGLIVIRRDGTMPGWREATLRTLFRLLEVNPFLLGGIPAGLIIIFSSSNQRLGDMAAGTVVVALSDLEFVEDTVF